MNPQDLLPPEVAPDSMDDAEFQARVRLEEAASFLDLDAWLVERLCYPDRELTLTLAPASPGAPVAIAYRVQHARACGPTLGEVHFRRAPQLHQLRARAMHATWQCALLEIPFGGSAGAVAVEADALPEPELHRLAVAYVDALQGWIGGDADILVPRGAGAENLADWMAAALHPATRLAGGAVLGKSEANFGLAAQANVRGRSIALLLEAIARDAQRGLRGLRVAIQGFGHLGRAAAAALADAGALLVGVADRSGAVLNPRGLDVSALAAHVRRQRAVYGFEGGEPALNLDLLACDCDALLLAAAPGQLDAAIAPAVRAAVLLEAVEGAVSPAAAEILAARHLVLAPELLVTAGDVLGPYLEWRQAQRDLRLAPAQVTHTLRARIHRAWACTRELTRQHGIALERAAHGIALRRVAARLEAVARA